MNGTTGKSSEIARKSGLGGGRPRGCGRVGLVLAALAPTSASENSRLAPDWAVWRPAPKM